MRQPLPINPQLLAYATLAAEVCYACPDIIVVDIGDIVHHAPPDYVEIEKRALAIMALDDYNRNSVEIDRKYADLAPDVIKRERTRDWEQRDRKRRRK